MSQDPPRRLEDIRVDIDSVDAQLISLLSRRTELAMEIGKIKATDGKPFFTPERERSVHENLRRRNPGPLSNEQLIAIFREVISAARAAEKPMRVAYWGPPGTFSNLAAIQTFGTSSEMVSLDSIEDVFTATERGTVDYGVAPIENSIAGVIPETLDMFAQTNVKICAEQYVKIQHHLASLATGLSEIRRVYAGPQPAAQCRRWLRANVPNAEIIETAPTTRAAERAVDDPEGAAIVNRLGATLYSLPILAEHIEDNAKNNTRFVVVGFNEPAKTGRDKTSLIFNLRNRPGELYRALGALVEEGVNLMMIESRPAPRATFEYLFFCDCVGHRFDENFQRALNKLRELTLETNVLGSYPAADAPL